MKPDAQYVIVWEFKVSQARDEEFVQKYGPEGHGRGSFAVPQAIFERSW